MKDLGLILLALVSVASAWGTIASPGAVYSALFLTVNLLTIAVCFLTMGAQFLGAAQILVYAGAIMVLFLFAVTLLAPREDPLLRRGHPSRAVGLLVGVATAGLLAGFLSLASFWSPGPAGPLQGTAQGFSAALLGPFVFPFEATALVLLTALLGVVVLGLGRPPGPREGQDV